MKMQKRNIRQTSSSDAGAGLPAPKLHLVKGGSLDDDISALVGLSHPKEIEPSSSEINTSEMSPALLQAMEDVKLFRSGEINATELRNRHPKTYKNWDDMKQRCRGKPASGQLSIELDPRFEKFADFLEIMGPRPEPTWSVDRIDPTGPYSPDNVRWASKTTQARNRTNAVYLTYQGVTRLLVEWAVIVGRNASTLRRRKRDGWTDEEIITGDRKREYPTGNPVHTHNSRNPFDHTPWPIPDREIAERAFQLYGRWGEHRLAFMQRYALERMAAFNSIADDDVSWPDDYTPTLDEMKEAEDLNTRYQRCVAALRDARMKLSPNHPPRLYKQRYLPNWVESSLAKYAP